MRSITKSPTTSHSTIDNQITPLCRSTIMSLTSKVAVGLVRRSSQLPAVRQSAIAVQKRNRADASTSHVQFTSPFHRGTDNHEDTTVIPSFKKYRSSGSEQRNQMFSYFMVGAFGGLSALGAKDTVQRRFHGWRIIY